MVTLEDVRKSYAGGVALVPTTLHVARGLTLSLIGPSGCGKSTLLRMLVGLVAPDAGRITVGGTPLGPDTLPALRLRIGYVIQDGGLFPHLTCHANVTLVARHLRWSTARVAARVAELAELVRLPLETLARFPAEVSGGQRQRVALMRALMLDPDLLLLDEPLAALDPLVRSELQDELGRIFGAVDKTVILVTHDMAEAAFFGDEIALMKKGAIVQRGVFDELAMRPVDPFVTQFLRAHRRLPDAGRQVLS